MSNNIFYNLPSFKDALKSQEEYNIALIKYGETKCNKAKNLAKCTPYSFAFCIKLTDHELDMGLVKHCKLD